VFAPSKAPVPWRTGAGVSTGTRRQIRARGARCGLPRSRRADQHGAVTAPDPPADLAGLPVEEAAQRCRAAGFTTVRVLGPHDVVTMEFRDGRVNLLAEDGVVRSVTVG
jgi:uncharacterized protein YfaQ (DUF2300 family)